MTVLTDFQVVRREHPTFVTSITRLLIVALRVISRKWSRIKGIVTLPIKRIMNRNILCELITMQRDRT
jgi:hypothetical protein